MKDETSLGDSDAQVLCFVRGADFKTSIGTADWRIGLFLNGFGFQVFIFGKGTGKRLCKGDTVLISGPSGSIPIISGVLRIIVYLIMLFRVHPDIIICNIGCATAGYLYRLIRPRVKLIIDVRSVPVETKGLLGWVAKAHFKIMIRTQLMDGLTTISDGMLKQLMDDYGFNGQVPVHIWPSGYDQKVFNPGVSGRGVREELGLDNNLLLLFHGSITRNRGLESIILALHQLKKKGVSEVKALFIGSGPYLSKLRELAKDFGVEDKIFFLPPVAHDQIPRLIAAVDLGIDPLPNLDWWRYQSSLKVVECLAMGKPVIATDIPAHRNLSSSVLLIPNNSPEEIAAAIERYIRMGSKERGILRMRAIEDVRPHSWKQIASNLADFIKNDILHK